MAEGNTQTPPSTYTAYIDTDLIEPNATVNLEFTVPTRSGKQGFLVDVISSTTAFLIGNHYISGGTTAIVALKNIASNQASGRIYIRMLYI